MAECIIAGRGSSSYTSNKPVYRSSITITNSTELPLPTALHNEYEVLYLAVAVVAVIQDQILNLRVVVEVAEI